MAYLRKMLNEIRATSPARGAALPRVEACADSRAQDDSSGKGGLRQSSEWIAGAWSDDAIFGLDTKGVTPAPWLLRLRAEMEHR